MLTICEQVLSTARSAQRHRTACPGRSLPTTGPQVQLAQLGVVATATKTSVCRMPHGHDVAIPSTEQYVPSKRTTKESPEQLHVQELQYNCVLSVALQQLEKEKGPFVAQHVQHVHGERRAYKCKEGNLASAQQALAASHCHSCASNVSSD